MRAAARSAVLLAASVAAAATSDVEWGAWKRSYGRSYASAAEEQARRGLFAVNMRRAAAAQRANPLARFGANHLSDRSDAELAQLRGLVLPSAEQRGAPEYVPTARDPPASADWRQKGAVTGVKDQAQCGSCWAFSTVANIEGQWFLAGNNLTSLSEQEFVSCDNPEHGGLSFGCKGGNMAFAFDWLTEFKGGQVVTESSYPYVSGAGDVPKCDLSGKAVGAKISGHKKIKHDEAVMAAALAEIGPLATPVGADGWSSYQGGILTDCHPTKQDHGVTLVGYGTEAVPVCTVGSSLGCFADSGSRILPFPPSAGNDPEMTLEACARFCSASGHTYMGVEAGDQCFCGSAPPPDSAKADGCTQGCPANATQACGGDWRINIYQLSCDGTTNVDYWLIKNSWGPSYGESGYIRIGRGTNQCLVQGTISGGPVTVTI